MNSCSTCLSNTSGICEEWVTPLFGCPNMWIFAAVTLAIIIFFLYKIGYFKNETTKK